MKDFVKVRCSEAHNGKLLVDVLAENSKFSKSQIKKMMVDGSVFQIFKGSRKHARKARLTVKQDDVIECYFDPSIDHDIDFDFKTLFESSNFGIYHKPAGAMTEGTNYGDKSSLIRHVQKLKKYVFLINRLDREIEGLVVVAFNSKSQNMLQEMWRDGVQKRYQAIIMGEMTGSGTIEAKINKKPTITKYHCVESENNETRVEIELLTERKHQIRIHFSDQGYPVMGDPIFGQHNKNNEGIKLLSYGLKFKDPHSQKLIDIELDKSRLLF